jgi:hypothetical protein
MAAEFDIIVRADRDFYLPLQMITSLGNPANLTNFQLKMTVKQAQGDPDAIALFAGTPIGGANLAFGIFTFHITPTQNQSWWVSTPGEIGAPLSTTMVYDVSCKDLDNNFITLMEGSVGVIGPVTVAIP